MKFQSIT